MSLSVTARRIVERELSKLDQLASAPEPLSLDDIRSLQVLTVVIRNLELPADAEEERLTDEDVSAAVAMLESA